MAIFQRMELCKNFEIVSTNLTSVSEPCSVSTPRYRYWVRFLNEYSNVRYALVTRTTLNHDALREIYCSAVDTSSKETLSFKFSILNRDITVTEHDLNRILHLPTKDHDPYPEVYELYGFFRGISYQSEVTLGNMYKHFLPREWNFFFHTLSRVFAPKRGGFHGITHFIQVVGFAVAYNLNINFGKLIMEQILDKMGDVDERDIMKNDVHCFYPRFLQLILDDVLTDEEKYIFCDSNTRPSHYLKTNVITGLESRNLYPTIRAHVTGFMFECFLDMALPQLPSGGLQAFENIMNQNQDQALNDEAEGKNTETQTPSNLNIHPVEPPVVVGNDYQTEIPQFVTKVRETNTRTYMSSTTQLLKRKEPPSQEGDRDVALRVTNKDVSESDLAILSLMKKRIVEQRASISQSVPSQKDKEQFIVPFSQQDGSIEIGMSIRTSCNESNLSDHAQTLQNLSSEISFAQRGVSYTKGELTAATILFSMSRNENMAGDSEKNQVASHVSEEKLGSLQIYMPFSTLPEGTSRAPLRDLPSTEDGRQLDLIEERDSRNAVTLPVASIEGTTVISFTGMQEFGSSVGMRDTPAELVSEIQTPKSSENREKSSTPAKPTSEKTTLIQNTQQFVSRSEFEAELEAWSQRIVARFEVSSQRTIAGLEASSQRTVAGFEALDQKIATAEACITTLDAGIMDIRRMVDEFNAAQRVQHQIFDARLTYLENILDQSEKKPNICQVSSTNPSSDMDDN